jgi:hypothetical protein
MDSSKSAGVHLVLLNRTMTGEWFGRKAALLLMKHSSLVSESPLLLSTQCDIQLISEWHADHVPYHTVVKTLATEFLKEDELNRKFGQSNPSMIIKPGSNNFDKECQCNDMFSHKHRPLLGMNTIMVETLPYMESGLRGSMFHSIQSGLDEPWREEYSRPSTIPSENAWVSDASMWFEDHFVMYNATLLSEIVDQFALVHNTVSEGPRALPQLLCQKGWKNNSLE